MTTDTLATIEDLKTDSRLFVSACLWLAVDRARQHGITDREVLGMILTHLTAESVAIADPGIAACFAALQENPE